MVVRNKEGNEAAARDVGECIIMFTHKSSKRGLFPKLRSTTMAAQPSSYLPNGAPAAVGKKTRESDRHQKQKKNKAPSDAAATAYEAEEEKSDPKPPMEIEVDYVAEEPDLADGLLADFKSIFDKFTFKDTPAAAEVYTRSNRTHPPPIYL